MPEIIDTDKGGVLQTNRPAHAPKDRPVTLEEAASKYVLLLAGVIASLVVFAVLGDKPFGWQLATAICYTTAVFCWVFFRWRYLPESFSLRDKRIQEQLPRAAATHGVFLTFLLLALTEWSAIRPQLPAYWLKESSVKHESLYGFVLIMFCTVTFLAQVLVTRRILKRAMLSRKKPEA